MRPMTPKSHEPDGTASAEAPCAGAPSSAAHPSTSPWIGRVAFLALLVTALNLRPAATGLGPVLAEVRAGLGMSATAAGLLTSMPALCFAVVGFAAPRLTRRHGPDIVVLVGMTALTAGLALRPLATGTAVFVALSAVALAGIALANVLLPVVVKERFPHRVGTMTGWYAMALSLGSAAAAAVTVPLTRAFGGDWRIGLGSWALVAALAVPPWVVLARDKARSRAKVRNSQRGEASSPARTGVPLESSAPDASRAERPASTAKPLTRVPTAWALAVYFGLQATAAYTIIGWLPQLFRDAGLAAETAGLLSAAISVLGVPLSFVLAAAAGRFRSQSRVAVVIGLFGLAGYAGLWSAPAAAPWLWVVLLGISNCAFPLSLTMIGLRGGDGHTVIRLSAFAQSSGYVLSIPGPILVGALYEHSGDWDGPLLLLCLLMVPQIIAGYFAGRDRRVD